MAALCRVLPELPRCGQDGRLIRVYRALPGESLGLARARAPAFVFADHGALAKQLLSRVELSAREADALASAARSIVVGASVEIVLAPGGDMYRVFDASETLARTDVETGRWTAREPGASVLLVDDERWVCERMCEMLRFLGYDATLLGVKPGEAPDEVLSRIASRAPLVVLLGEGLARRCGQEMVEGCRQEPSRGVVALVRDAASGLDVDASLHRPIAAREAVAVLDPILGRIRELHAP